MSEVIKPEDLIFLSGLTWWTANRTHPYIIKGGIQGNNYQINLFQVWFNKSDENTIRFNHTIFNKAINIEKTSDILGLMEEFLVNGDPKAEISFQQIDHNNLLLKIKIELKVCCPFVWEYDLVKVSKEQIKDILLGQLIGPLVSSVHCLERRTNYLKQQFIELEEEYKKRLTPLEKNSYKSNFIDEEFVWEQIINKDSNEKLEKIQFSDATKYFMIQNSRNLLGFKPNEINSNLIEKEKNNQNLGSFKRKNLKETMAAAHNLSNRKKSRKSRSKSNSKMKEKDEEKKIDKKLKKEKKSQLNFL